MTITGENGASVEVDTYQHTEEDPPEVTLMIDDGHNRHRMRITFDAKQALALSLARHDRVNERNPRWLTG